MEDAAKLLETFKELEQSKLEEFIWHLRFSVAADLRIPQGDLEGAKRPEVVGYMINRFKAGAGEITVQVLSKMNQNYLATSLEKKLQKGQQATRSAPVPVESALTRSDGKQRNMTPSSQEFQRTLQEKGVKIYRPTTSQRKGVALLITNITFDHLSYRVGAEKDEENMEWLLTALGYSVEKHRDLSGAEIEEKVITFSKRLSEHRDADSTFVVIMSHGARIENRDAILGVHYPKYQNPDDVYFVDKTFSHLNSESCPALINKPKVILIQACRGDHPGGVEVPGQVLVSDSWVHREKDFVCFMSSVPDTKSYRCAAGSLLIIYIVEVFCEWAHEQHIMELFTKVSDRMATFPGGTEEKLLPCLERTSLTKNFYLFPGF